MRDLIREHGAMFLVTAAAICGTMFLEQLDRTPVGDIPAVQVWDETRARPLTLRHNGDPRVYLEGWNGANGANNILIHSNLFMGSTERFVSFPDNSQRRRKRFRR